MKNRFLPPKGFLAINLLGFIFVRPGTSLTEVDIRHEQIHTRQMCELWVLPFYVLYVGEWLVRLMLSGDAYRNISFEREAYSHEHDADYLQHRSRFAWRKYFFKKNYG